MGGPTAPPPTAGAPAPTVALSAPLPSLLQRYRVCEKDALAEAVLQDGQLQRFCQQVPLPARRLCPLAQP